MNNKKRAPFLFTGVGGDNAHTKRGKIKQDYAVNVFFIHTLSGWYHAAVEQDDPKRFTYGKALK
jgi:hypothetical protein